jgi:hypothetical protein
MCSGTGDRTVSGFALVLGLAHEPPIAGVIRELEQMSTPYLVVDQRRLVAGNWRTWFTDAGASGVVDIEEVQVSLDDVTGVYTRLMNWADLPEIVAEPPLLEHAGRLHEAIDAWLETTSARVVNRTSANDTNNSKPYQAMIIRDHFDIPATLVTNDPEALLAFWDEFGHLIYKSASGERSIVNMLTNADLERLHLLASAPVQFQEYVSGVDVRVHVIGSDVFATRVDCEAIDYRYDRSGSARMSAIEIPSSVAGECVALTARLGLELSGVDLRFAEDGRIICFEVNPSPAYSVYEDATGQPIAAAIARRLSGI